MKSVKEIISSIDGYNKIAPGRTGLRRFDTPTKAVVRSLNKIKAKRMSAFRKKMEEKEAIKS